MKPSQRMVLFPPAYPNSRRIYPTTDSGYETYADDMRLFLPAATNYIKNPQPSHTANLIPGQWTSAYTDSTPTYSNGAAHDGITSKHLRLVGGAAPSPYGGLTFHGSGDATAVTPAETLTLSVDVGEAAFTGCTSRLTLVYYTSGDVYVSRVWGDSIAAASEFATYTLSSVVPATAAKCYAGIRAYNDFGAGDVLDYSIAKVSLVKSSIATPYFDGTYDDCAWTGTAHASTSTRTASSLVLGTSLGFTTVGTIAARVSPLYAAADGVGHYLLSLDDGGLAAFGLYKRSTNVWGVLNASALRSNIAAAQAANSIVHLVGRIDTDATTSDLNVDGSDAVQGASAADLADRITIGSNPGGSAPGPHYIGPVLISPTRKSDEWVDAIQADDGAAFSDLRRLWRDFMSAGDLLLPLQSDGNGMVKR